MAPARLACARCKKPARQVWVWVVITGVHWRVPVYICEQVHCLTEQGATAMGERKCLFSL